MSRRLVSSTKRVGDSASLPFGSSSHQKSQKLPVLPIVLVVLGGFLLIGFVYKGIGGSKEAPKNEVLSCSLEVERAIPLLKKAYGDSMHRVLHVGPDTCSLVTKFSKEESVEAWGIEPYDLEDTATICKTLVHKGIVRVADIKFSLPYKSKSFSLVVVSDALDYLSTKYLNKTLLDLARVSRDGLVIFSGYPGQPRGTVSDPSKMERRAKLRSSSWWIRYFVQSRLEENDDAIKKFEQAANEALYKPSCQIFHLRSYS